MDILHTILLLLCKTGIGQHANGSLGSILGPFKKCRIAVGHNSDNNPQMRRGWFATLSLAYWFLIKLRASEQHDLDSFGF